MSKSRSGRERFFKTPKVSRVMKSSGAPMIPNLGRCAQDQNKAIFTSRSDAKKACKSKTLDHPIEPYRCTAVDGWWHVGGKLRDPRLLNQ